MSLSRFGEPLGVEEIERRACRVYATYYDIVSGLHGSDRHKS